MKVDWGTVIAIVVALIVMKFVDVLFIDGIVSKVGDKFNNYEDD